MERTLEEALANLFGEDSLAKSPKDGPAIDSDDGVAVPGGRSLSELVELVQGHFRAAESAAREGNWAGYGERTRQLGTSLERLSELAAQNAEATEEEKGLGTEDAVNGEPAGE